MRWINQLYMDPFKSNTRETWCVILVSVSWHILLRITALYTSFRSAQNHCLPDNVRPRGAFISVGDCTPTEKDLLLLTTCRSGSLLDWDKTRRWKYPIPPTLPPRIHYIKQNNNLHHNYQRHSNRKVVLLCLVSEQIHRNESAYRSAGKW